MRLSEMSNFLNCEILVGSDEALNQDISLCFGSDMMSDVLAFGLPGALLVTGLTNSQSVRTADVADACAVLYIRGKQPDPQTLALATKLDIPLLSTGLGMFDTCAKLHSNGVKGIS